MCGLLPREVVRRLAALRRPRLGRAHREPVELALLAEGGAAAGARARRPLDNDEAHAAVLARWGADLCGLLNALTRGELAGLASALGAPAAGRSPELRAALWDRGAQLEAGGAAVPPALQPRPILLGGHLVVQAPPRGPYPPSLGWPRPVPAAAPPIPPASEPETLDDLLAAADRAIGVRLGARGRDKGAWGQRAAALLGVVERGLDEPDWRGDVEVKTLPVDRDPSGCWRVAEDPAIGMLGEPVLSKLQRTLWLPRVTLRERGARGGERTDAAILSWYLLDWDAEVARLARRFLHERPKGPAGTAQRALYLHRRFFADAGLLATLNGPAAGRAP
jgi:hypothetical protein